MRSVINIWCWMLFCSVGLRPATGDQIGVDTAQTSVLLPLGPDTATQSGTSLPTESPVNLTFAYPSAGVNVELPWILLMPGFNCYASDYNSIQHQLAGKGYLVAIVDMFHPVTSDPLHRNTSQILSSTREPQCSNASFDSPTATILGDVHNLLTRWTGQAPSVDGFPTPPLTLDAQRAIKNMDLDSVVIVGHSAGGRVAIDMVTGLCEDPKEYFCPNYTISDRLRDIKIIKGIIAWESTGSVLMTNPILDIPSNIFVTYLSSYNGALASPTADAFHRTLGSCISYVQLSSGNHYAITDWNPHSAPYQQAACGPAVEVSETTTESKQKDRLVFIANLADATIKAHLLNDTAKANFLVEILMEDTLVHTADIAFPCDFA